jgi:hypothetical protein
VDRQILSEDNASFAYKGKAVDIKHVGRALGVRYVLEGTLQALKTHRRDPWLLIPHELRRKQGHKLNLCGTTSTPERVSNCPRFRN